MAYLAKWLKGSEIVAEDKFEDLLSARNFVLENMADYRVSLGIDSVKVCRGQTIYFQWNPARNA